LEKENNFLRLKVAGLQKELTENSLQLTVLSEENTNLKHVFKELQGRRPRACFIKILDL
jgi:hypothetical protein